MIDIALNTLRTLAFVLTQPIMVIFLIILAIGFYTQNKKTTAMQQMIIGEKLNSPLELTISQIVIGILAGIFISMTMTFLGVMFNENSPINLLFLFSMLLLLVDTKYVNFAYSGCFLGIISVILTLLSEVFSGKIVNLAGISISMSDINIISVDIVSLMTLVGLLYLVEGVLIILDGKSGSIPVFTNRGGKIIGGFAFRRYWMFPLVILMLLNNPEPSITKDLIQTPNWWPMVKTSIPLDVLEKAVITLAPFFGILGFSTVTFSRGKGEKIFITGMSSIIYGAVLTLVAQIANINIYTQIFVIFFAIVTHEVMVKIEEILELKKDPKYISDDDGIMVLAVAPTSPAFEMGIKSGDKLLEINNSKIETEKDIFSGLEMTNFIWLKIKRAAGNIEELSYNRLNSGKRLGIVFVPRSIPSDSLIVKLKDQGSGNIFDKLHKKKKL